MITIKEADAATYEKWRAYKEFPQKARGLIVQDGNRQAGYIWYETLGKQLRLLCLEAPDQLLAEGLVRAALHYADCHGVEDAVCGLTDWRPLWEHLGFIVNGERGGEEWQVSIREFFSRPCQGKHS